MHAVAGAGRATRKAIASLDVGGSSSRQLCRQHRRGIEEAQWRQVVLYNDFYFAAGAKPEARLYVPSSQPCHRLLHMRPPNLHHPPPSTVTACSCRPHPPRSAQYAATATPAFPLKLPQLRRALTPLSSHASPSPETLSFSTSPLAVTLQPDGSPPSAVRSWPRLRWGRRGQPRLPCLRRDGCVGAWCVGASPSRLPSN
jgi:hypothetical protein